MTVFDNPADVRREFAELRRRLDQLETQALLEFSSISEGSLQIRVPDGIDVNDGGSVKVGTDLKIGNTAGVGSVKSGTTEVTKDGVGSGGTKVYSDGKIGRDDGGEVATKDGFAVDGNLVVIGTVDGRGGLYTPWQGGKNTVEAIMGGIKTAAQNAATAASNADTKAGNAATAASNAHNRANAAYSLADAAATDNRVTAVNFKLNQAIDKLNALDSAVQGFHPEKPFYPPVVKD